MAQVPTKFVLITSQLALKCVSLCYTDHFDGDNFLVAQAYCYIHDRFMYRYSGDEQGGTKTGQGGPKKG